MRWQEHPLVDRLSYYLDRTRAWARRARPAPLMLRAVVCGTGFAALYLVLSSEAAPGVAIVLAGLFATLAAGFPGGSWVSVLEFIAVLVVGLRVWLGTPPGLVVVGVAALLLYLHHTAAALAAGLRTDALMPVVVLRRQALRAVVVVAGSAVLMVGVATVPETAAGWSPSLLTAAGAAAAFAVTAALAYVAKVRRRSDPDLDLDQ